MKTATSKTKNTAEKCENRVRYNAVFVWGFWDGVKDNREGLTCIDGLTAETVEESQKVSR